MNIAVESPQVLVEILRHEITLCRDRLRAFGKTSPSGRRCCSLHLGRGETQSIGAGWIAAEKIGAMFQKTATPATRSPWNIFRLTSMIYVPSRCVPKPRMCANLCASISHFQSPRSKVGLCRFLGVARSLCSVHGLEPEERLVGTAGGVGCGVCAEYVRSLCGQSAVLA